MRSKRPQPSPRPRTLERDLAAIGLIILGLLLFTSLVNAHREAGPLLAFLSGALTAMLGIGAWAVPLACLVAGVMLGMTQPRSLARQPLTGGVIVYVIFLAMVHLAAGPGDRPLSADTVRLAGGYLGGALAWLLARTLGDVGAYIVLVGAALAGVLLLAQTSWSEFLAGLGEAVITLGRSILAGFARLAPRRPPSRRPKTPAGAKPAIQHRPPTPVSSAAHSPRPPSVLHDEDEILTAPGERRSPDSESSDSSEASGGQDSDDAATEADTSTEQTAGPEQVAAQHGAPAAVAHAAAATPRQPRLLDVADRPKPQWRLPDVEVLSPHPDDRATPADAAEIKEKIRVLERTLLNFGIPARVRNYEYGPTLTRFEVELEPGIRVSKVTQLQGDLAMALAVGRIRIEAPIPGKRAIGIEVPNAVRRIVSLRSVVEEPEFQEHPSLLAVALGRDVAGRPVVVDLENMPHLLVAGQTGSGKSVCLHTLIVSLLMRATPDTLRLVLIDPKRVEMTRYDGIPHLYAPVVYTLREAADVLRKTIREMQRRYDKFAVAGVANIAEYNEEVAGTTDEDGKVIEPLPRVVVVIDELADLMIQARAEFEQSICRLAQLARATGIHVVIATQRPSVNVITGHIKANFPARIALRLPAQHDSRTILDCVGADRLLGNGDMLLMTSELSKPLRVQGAYVDRADVERLAAFFQDQGEPEFAIVPEVAEEEGAEAPGETEVGDELFEAAVRYVVAEQEASVSMLQRRFKVGYARAGRLVDLMERRGIVGPHEGSRPRRVLIGPHNVEQVLAGLRSGRRSDEADTSSEAEAPTPSNQPAL
ncbi:MAG: DNA translocase FtsK [Armatimonadetes bacterium]|nr:DNA translocase FtsK [Armatimonadota bacterium]